MIYGVKASQKLLRVTVEGHQPLFFSEFPHLSKTQKRNPINKNPYGLGTPKNNVAKTNNDIPTSLGLTPLQLETLVGDKFTWVWYREGFRDSEGAPSLRKNVRQRVLPLS